MTEPVPDCPQCGSDLFVESDHNGTWVCRFDDCRFGSTEPWRAASWTRRAGMQQRWAAEVSHD